MTFPTFASKHSLKLARVRLNSARRAYYAARRVAVRSRTLYSMGMALHITRADTFDAAIAARDEYTAARRWLARLETLPVLPHGGRYSPAALKRNGFDPSGVP